MKIKFILKNERLPYKKRITNAIKKIHILGNGPSLKSTINKIDLENDEVLMVNFSPNTEMFFKLKPKFFALADPAFFKYKNHFRSTDIENLYSNLEKVNWNMTIFIPSHFDLKIKNKNITIKKVFSLPFEGNVHLRNFLYKHNFASPKFQNVVILAIYSLINYGFKNIYLHGVETDSYKKVYINLEGYPIYFDEHYYGKEKINLVKTGFCKKGEFYKYLFAFAIMLKNYKYLKDYADFMNVEIYNYTINSMIDAFKKLSN